MASLNVANVNNIFIIPYNSTVEAQFYICWTATIFKQLTKYTNSVWVFCGY
jgi:hypothetical protein